MKLAIAYYRVSTRRQGESGLGLDAQKQIVQDHCRANGLQLLAEFSEVESGTHVGRPRLRAACRLARSRKATLIVAKLDRIARNVSFVASLMDSKIDFVVCDAPFANRLTLHILAAMAEYEAQMIGERTRVALKAVKARGKPLGSHRPGHWKGREQLRLDGLAKARKVAAEIKRQDTSDAYLDIAQDIAKLNDEGWGLGSIAKKLNERGELSREGKPWSACMVRRVLQRAKVERQRLIDSILTPKD